jgi:signal transduction histidine kinase
MTQSDAGMLAIDRETVDVLQVVDSAAAEHDAAAKAKGHDFVTDLEASAGRIEGDAKKLREAVSAMLANAIATTGDGGRILLHASGEPDLAVIVVSDDGPGNAVELPDVRATVEAHGGTYTHMAEPGVGTAIKIELPR